MRTIVTLLTALWTAMAAWAGTYTPAQVPNVHVADHTRHLSNPDGIISAAAQARVDSLVAQLRRETTAEMAVVVVDDIDNPSDIDDFATELFTQWGLGKKDRDNGVLLLVAKNRRKYAIRTGYGVEGVLPDIVCGHILRRQMLPHFRNGDFDGGIVAATETITSLLRDPDAAEELRSQLEDADRRDDIDASAAFLTLAGALAAIMVVLLAGKLYSLRRRSRYEKYMALEKWKPIYLILGFATLGMGMAAALPLVLLLQHWRNGRRMCQNCGARMNKVDEVHDNDYLTPSQDMEERVGSVDYDVWLCPKCGETDILPYVNGSSTMRECGRCHARTATLTAERTLRRPTAVREGEGVREYTCMNCHYITRVPYRLAKTPPVVVMPIGGGGRGGGGFGGGGFGGGFGGGMTGGGGASGGW